MVALGERLKSPEHCQRWNPHRGCEMAGQMDSIGWSEGKGKEALPGGNGCSHPKGKVWEHPLPSTQATLDLPQIPLKHPLTTGPAGVTYCPGDTLPGATTVGPASEGVVLVRTGFALVYFRALCF